ncbi:MAG: hypothetical protein IPH04_07340 [Saprospirales bacterium]|nr:hypothetical protein [Saprospirales bacterium]
MEFLKTLFASFDQAESLIFMAFVLIAFLIGFVLSWLVWTRQARKWRLEAQQSKAELKALQAEYQSFKDQFSLREADIQHAQVEAEESKRRMLGAQEDRSRIAAELEEAHAELARLQSSVAAQQVTIEDLNDQILGLRTKNETLVAESMETTDQVDEIDLQPIDAVAEMQSTFNAALQRLNAIEEKLRRIETENEDLKNRVAVAQAAPRSLAAVEQLFDTEVEEEDEEAIVQQAREYLQSAIGSMIPAAVEAQKDDLQQIHGIGPFLEKQLHSVGLYTYEQISKLDETLIEQLTKAIQFFPGRILKDDWVGQARRLHDNPTEAPHEFRPVSSENESLRIIEGIGPKIEALLADSGIHSLKDLAEADVERLQEILQAAGERYRLHDPSTWPEQARLATEGEWDQLKSFKEYLNRGEHKG